MIWGTPILGHLYWGTPNYFAVLIEPMIVNHRLEWGSKFWHHPFVPAKCFAGSISSHLISSPKSDFLMGLICGNVEIVETCWNHGFSITWIAEVILLELRIRVISKNLFFELLYRNKRKNVLPFPETWASAVRKAHVRSQRWRAARAARQVGAHVLHSRWKWGNQW